MSRTMPVRQHVEEDVKVRLEKLAESINQNIEILDEEDKDYTMEVLLLILTGLRKDQFNPAVFSILSQYGKENFGPVEIKISSKGSIEKIKLGKLEGGPLYCKSFSKEQLKIRHSNNLNTCGFIPTLARPEHLFLEKEGKVIMGKKAFLSSEDCYNVYFGDFYFNRQRIIGENAELTKLEFKGDNVLEETITSYRGKEKIKEYKDKLTIELARGNEYLVISNQNKPETSRFGIMNEEEDQENSKIIHIDKFIYK